MQNKVPHMPRFLGIGAARAGTTWLSQALNAHPDVWIPAIKELHYFTRAEKYVGPSQLIDAHPVRRLCSRRKPYRQYRRIALRALGSNLLHPSLRRLQWDANYLLRAPSDDWYASLFSQGYGRVTGEITPRYSILDADDIKALRLLIPDLKVIFVMRDPVERAWSLVKYHLKRGNESLHQVSAAELQRRALVDVISRQSDYEAILQRWRAHFGKDQFLALFHEEIAQQPEALLRRIQQFLGLSETGLPETMRQGKVNRSFDSSMPASLRKTLTEHYRPVVERMAHKEGGYFVRWLEQYGGAAAAQGRQPIRQSALPCMELVSP